LDSPAANTVHDNSLMAVGRNEIPQLSKLQHFIKLNTECVTISQKCSQFTNRSRHKQSFNKYA